MSVITLTTDFGTRDWFVGTMKGVILTLNPRAQVVDLSHEIPPGDIRAGAFVLMAGCRFFPRGTVHLAVVDPGVGSGRRAIAVQTAHGFFVGPDNGVLSFALRHEKVKSVRQLANEEFFCKPVSRTFHGRDTFAPVAAHLARGLAIEKLGPPLADFVRLPWPALRQERGAILGEVVHVDRFGNAITNIPMKALVSSGATEVRAGRRRLGAIADFYQAVPAGEAVAIVGSTGYLEIAVHGRSAAARFRLRPGTRVAACGGRRRNAGKK